MIDIQSTSGQFGAALQQVGVCNLRYPFQVRDSGSNESQQVAGQWSMSVALPGDQRGTHMSRFISQLEELSTTPLALDDHLVQAKKMARLQGSPTARLETAFIWFRKVEAPVSKLVSTQSYEVGFVSEYDATNTSSFKTLRLNLTAKAVCPCSKAISDRGAHNQRSDISVSLRFQEMAPVPALNVVIESIESCASSPLYPLLKRADEKFVTEQAYDHPVFVEDLARAVAKRLQDMPGLERLDLSVTNRESIHSHDCFASLSIAIR